MGRSSGEENPAAGVDLIDLDDYMKSPVFQLANQQRACVIDVGTCDNRLPPDNNESEFKNQCNRNLDRYSYGNKPSARRCAGDRKVPSSDYNAPYNQKREDIRSSAESESSYTFKESGGHKQYSLDSGVSDGGRCRRHRRSGFHSNVDFYETRRRKDLERSGHKLRSRDTIDDVGPHRNGSHILDTLKLQQEKIDRLAALYEECIQPKSQPVQRKTQPARTKQPKLSSSSELSSSVATRDEASGSRLAEQEKSKRMDGKVKTYKIIMRKLDELNRHLVSNVSDTRQRAQRARSKSSSESVSVSDKAVCTDIPVAKTHKPKTASARTAKTASARTEARTKISKYDENSSTNSSQETISKPRRRRKSKPLIPTRQESEKIDFKKFYSTERFERKSNERSNSLNSVEISRMKQIYTAFAKSGFDPSSQHRPHTSEYNLFGINDYNLNDPISFYNRAKRQARHKNPPPQVTNLCTLCHGYWCKLRANGSELCRHLLCCSDTLSARSGLLGERT